MSSSSAGMEDLMERGVHAALMRIFLFLDTRSLRNAACVSKSWRSYIRRFLWQSVAGRKALRKKLDANWRYGLPDDATIECAANVFDMQSDDKSFIFGLENGSIEVWNKQTLTKTLTLTSGDQTPLRVAVNKKVVIGGFFNKKIHVWKRRTGEYVQLVNAESNMIYSIKASGDYVATSLVNGVVKIYGMEPVGYLLTLRHTLHTGDGAVKYIDVDGHRIVTVAYRKPVTMWDMETGESLCSMENRLPANGIRFSFPHAISLHRDGMVKVWDMLAAQLLRIVQTGEQDYYHTAFDGFRLALSDVNEIVVYFMEDVGNDERWEADKACVEEPSANLHVCNAMMLESDKLVYQTRAEGVVKVHRFWFVKGEKAKHTRGALAAAGPWLFAVRLALRTALDLVKRVVRRLYPW